MCEKPTEHDKAQKGQKQKTDMRKDEVGISNPACQWGRSLAESGRWRDRDALSARDRPSAGRMPSGTHSPGFVKGCHVQ